MSAWLPDGTAGPVSCGVRHSECRHGDVAEWFRQGPAKPCTRVRFPASPPASDLLLCQVRGCFRFPRGDHRGPPLTVRTRCFFRAQPRPRSRRGKHRKANRPLSGALSQPARPDAIQDLHAKRRRRAIALVRDQPGVATARPRRPRPARLDPPPRRRRRPRHRRTETAALPLFHTAGQIITTGRRRICRLSATWTWADELVAAFTRLHTLPIRS